MTRPTFRLAVALALELGVLASLPLVSNLGLDHFAAIFVGLFLVAGLGYLLAVHSAGNVEEKWQPIVLWSVAIALRVVVLPAAPGDDFWRYLWEGHIQQLGFNPYLLNPDAAALVPYRDAVWHAVNHRDFAAIYPPGVELIFSLLSLLRSPPLLTKILFTAADLGVIALLLLWLKGDFSRVIWYAWNPAIVYSFAGAGHFDSLMILPLLGAFLVSEIPKPSWRTLLASSFLLGVSISIKIVPIFLVPLWILRAGRRWPAVLPAVLLPASLTFFYGGLATVSRPLKDFAYVTRFDDLLWWVVEATIWPNPMQKNGRSQIVLSIVLAILTFHFRNDWRRAALWIFGATLILSPVLHPWYLTWILPLACARRQSAWFILSLSATIALLVWDDGPFWRAWDLTWPLRLGVSLPPLFWILFWRDTSFSHEPAHA